MPLVRLHWSLTDSSWILHVSRNEPRLRVLFVLAAFGLTTREGVWWGSWTNFSRFGSGILSKSGIGPDLVSKLGPEKIAVLLWDSQ